MRRILNRPELGAENLDPAAADDTLGAVLKDREDLELVRPQLAHLTEE